MRALASAYLNTPSDQRLGQYLTLALLLHLLLLVLVGNTPGGSASPGEGVWGSFNVRLRDGAPRDTSPGPPRPAPPAAVQRGPVGEAKGERMGGLVRSEAVAESLPPTPGAARLGQWNKLSGARLEAETRSPPVTPLQAPELQHPLPELEALPRQPLPVPQTTAVLQPPSTTPHPRSAAREQPLAPLSPTVAETASPLPAAPDLPPAATLPAAPSTALQRLPAAAALPTLSSDGGGASSAGSSALQPAPAAPELPAPRQLGGSPQQNIERASSSPQPALQPLSAAPAGVAPLLLPGLPAPPVIGAPDAGARLGQDLATPPSAPASAPPPQKLNLSLPRGGELSGRSSRGALQLLPRPPERKSKLTESLENASRKDCREAHADKGLLAVGPLLLGAASDKGCKW